MKSDNSTKKKKNAKNNEAKDLIAKYQIINFKKDKISIKDYLIRR